jgi:hypothetical protein
MPLADILHDLEADALPAAPGQFHAIATEYLGRSRNPANDSPQPTAHSP